MPFAFLTQVHTALELFVFVAGVLLILGLIGGFALLPFRGRYLFLFAPLAGLMILPIGIGMLYVVGRQSFLIAAGVSCAGFAGLTIVAALRSRLPPSRDLIAAGLLGLSVIALSVYLHAVTTITNASPSLFFGDSPEQATYAQVADWITTHPIVDLDAANPQLSELLARKRLRDDPRAGSYYTLALVATLHRTRAIFGYDVACAAVWAAAILGVAAVFAGTSLSLVLLVIGLIASAWFDYDRSAFFGKLLAYPSALAIAGLACRHHLAGFPMLCLLTIGCATLHPGVSTALIIVTIVGTYVLLAERTLAMTVNVAVLAIAAVAVTGLLSYAPWRVHYPDWRLSWSYIIPRVLDIESQGPLSISGFTATQSLVASGVVLIAWLLLGIIAWRQDREAAALFLGPAALLAGLAAAKADAATFQLIGFFYPATLCGCARLDRRGSRMAVILFVVLVGLRAPRFAGGLDRWTVHPNADRVYSAAMLEAVLSRPEGVMVDTADLDLGHLMRGFADSVSWSELGWHASRLDGLSGGRSAPVNAAALILRHGGDRPDCAHVVWRSPSIVLCQPK